MSIFDKAAPAVRRETKRVAVITAVCTLIMWAVFAIGHLAAPGTVPFDYRVILGGIGGALVAVLNFFMMGMGIQKATNETDEAGARMVIRASYSRRMVMQVIWLVLALVLPFIQPVAGVLPLLFPSTGIKVMSILGFIKS